MTDLAVHDGPIFAFTMVRNSHVVDVRSVIGHFQVRFGEGRMALEWTVFTPFDLARPSLVFFRAVAVCWSLSPIERSDGAIAMLLLGVLANGGRAGRNHEVDRHEPTVLGDADCRAVAFFRVWIGIWWELVVAGIEGIAARVYDRIS
jgi:hypothetical protein